MANMEVKHNKCAADLEACQQATQAQASELEGLATVKVNNSNLADEVTKLKSSIKDLTASNGELQNAADAGQVGTAGTGSGALAQQNKELEAQLQTASDQVTELEGARQKLEHDNVKMKSDLEKIQSKDGDAQAQEAATVLKQRLEKEKEDLTVEVNRCQIDLTAAKKEAKMSAKELVNQKDTNTDLAQKVKDLEGEISKQKASMTTEVTKLEKEISKQKITIEGMTKQVENLVGENKKQTVIIYDLKTKVSELEVTNKQFADTNDKMTKELQQIRGLSGGDAQAKEAAAALEGRLKTLRIQNDDLSEKVRDCETTKNKQKVELEWATNELSRKQTDVDEAQAKVRVLAVERTEQKGTIDHLTIQVREKEQTADQLRSELKIKTAELEKLGEEKTEHDELVKQKESAVRAEQEKVNKCQSDLSDAKTKSAQKLEKQEKTNTNLAQQVTKLEREISQQKYTIEGMTKQAEEDKKNIAERMNQANTKVSELEKQLTEVRSEFDEAEEDKKNIAGRMNKAEARAKYLGADNNLLKKDKEKAEKKHDELVKQKESAARAEQEKAEKNIAELNKKAEEAHKKADQQIDELEKTNKEALEEAQKKAEQQVKNRNNAIADLETEVKGQKFTILMRDNRITDLTNKKTELENDIMKTKVQLKTEQAQTEENTKLRNGLARDLDIVFLAIALLVDHVHKGAAPEVLKAYTDDHHDFPSVVSAAVSLARVIRILTPEKLDAGSPQKVLSAWEDIERQLWVSRPSADDGDGRDTGFFCCAWRADATFEGVSDDEGKGKNTIPKTFGTYHISNAMADGCPEMDPEFAKLETKEDHAKYFDLTSDLKSDRMPTLSAVTYRLWASKRLPGAGKAGGPEYPKDVGNVCQANLPRYPTKSQGVKDNVAGPVVDSTTKYSTLSWDEWWEWRRNMGEGEQKVADRLAVGAVYDDAGEKYIGKKYAIAAPECKATKLQGIQGNDWEGVQKALEGDAANVDENEVARDLKRLCYFKNIAPTLELLGCDCKKYPANSTVTNTTENTNKSLRTRSEASANYLYKNAPKMASAASAIDPYIKKIGKKIKKTRMASAASAIDPESDAIKAEHPLVAALPLPIAYKKRLAHWADALGKRQ